MKHSKFKDLDLFILAGDEYLYTSSEPEGIVVTAAAPPHASRTRALADGKPAVGLKDFARFYAERTGDVSARNPFLVPDFRSIPTGRAPLDPEPPTPPKGRPKKPRRRR